MKNVLNMKAISFHQNSANNSSLEIISIVALKFKTPELSFKRLKT